MQTDGVIDWLLSCPVKGFFVAVKSEIYGHVVKYLVEKAAVSIIDAFAV